MTYLSNIHAKSSEGGVITRLRSIVDEALRSRARARNTHRTPCGIGKSSAAIIGAGSERAAWRILLLPKTKMDVAIHK